MRIYWYWAHPHAAASQLALALMRPGDELVVQALPSLRGELFGPIASYEVIRDLPDPTLLDGVLRRRLRPLELSVRRSAARRRLLRRGFDVALIETLVYYADWLDLRTLPRHAPPLVSIVHDIRPHRHAFPRTIEDKLLRALYRPECSGHLVVFSATQKD